TALFRSREAAGAATADRETCRVDQPLVRQRLGAGDAVLHVDDAPFAVQAGAVRAAIAGAAAVVHVEDGEAPAGPELPRHAERRRRRPGRPAVALHDQGRQLALRRREVWVHRRVVEAVRRLAVLARPAYRTGDGDRVRVDGDVPRAAQVLPLAGFDIQPHHAAGIGRARAEEDDRVRR